MFNVKGILLNLFITLTGCSSVMNISKDPDSDFELLCSRWDPNIVVCEDYIKTNPITGYLKVWHFKDDPHYGTNLFICGADLTLNTGSLIKDQLAQMETKNKMLCVNAEDNELWWGWDEQSSMNINWENIYLELDIPKCFYDEKICTIKAYGYVSVE